MFGETIVGYIIQYFSQDNFAQVFGFAGMITILIAYLQKDDLTVKKLMLLSSLFWGTHFYLLGVYSGLAAVVIWVLRLVLSLKFQKSYRAFLLIVGVTLVTGYFTFDGIFSLLPVITSLSGAYSFFFLEKIKLRLAMMFNSSVWLVYHISIGSISGMMNEVFTQTILIATVYRMLHPEGGTRYYAQKIREILWKKSRPDYDRFVFIHDKVSEYRKSMGVYFLHILHYDLRNILKKKKASLIDSVSQTVGDASIIDTSLKKMHITK